MLCGNEMFISHEEDISLKLMSCHENINQSHVTRTLVKWSYIKKTFAKMVSYEDIFEM